MKLRSPFSWALVALNLGSLSCSLRPEAGELRSTLASSAGGAGGANSGAISFARDIRPLMNRADDDPSGHGCKQCHYPGVGTEDGLMASGLDLSTLGSLRRGGSTATAGIIVVPGHPEQSAIVQKLEGTYETGSRMPKSGPPYWSPPEIQLMKDWIEDGAKGEDAE